MWKGVVLWLTVMVFGLMVCGCSRLVHERLVTVSDTCYVERYRRDSVVVQDSTYIHEYLRQDTLFIERVRWRSINRERVLRDTLRVVVRDTVLEKRMEVGRGVETAAHSRGWIGGACMFLGLVILCVVFLVMYRVIKNKLWK